MEGGGIWTEVEPIGSFDWALGSSPKPATEPHPIYSKRYRKKNFAIATYMDCPFYLQNTESTEVTFDRRLFEKKDKFRVVIT